MMMETNIAGVIILYHPGNEVIDNIRSFLGQIGKLYVVDNSENRANSVVHDIMRLDRVEYISFGANRGIAHALNVGARKAIADGYDYLLTMDQDSTATPDMIRHIMTCYEHPGTGTIGVVAPYHLTDLDVTPDITATPCREELTVWTSGCILDLRVYRVVGPFLDELFIDFVDHEYCLRLNAMGFKVMRSCSAILKHKIGNAIRRRRLFRIPLIVSNHSVVRRYYITRNRLFVAKKYKKLFPDFYWDDRKKFIAEIVTILLYEEHKIKKLLMIGKGIVHYIVGRQGSIVAGGTCE